MCDRPVSTLKFLQADMRFIPSSRTLFRIVIAIGALAVALFVLDHFYPSETMRYRMTVVVDTPSGERSGSSVIEAGISRGPSLLPEMTGISYGLKGEAVAVELPDGRVMFALLAPESGGDPTGYQMHLFERAVKHDPALSAQFGPAILNDWRQFWPAVRRSKLSFTLRRADYPMLVTFADLNDPASVKRVDPSDLAASFGNGFSLKRINVQITNDRVTTGIEKRLGWLSKYPEPSLDPKHGPRDYSLSAILHHGAFQTGGRE
ncbi:hypothetical protein GRI58_15100 [Porphyrobacter algicida]|uniref:Uncharacterized protein n=1 Tax=Qipengyuania algicida TaxID=1836209 RepID=A0A845AMM2_9SPHN|nr:hypothetical protein [Qipengyuania algicida]MXP30135.1 hypothetical protein [Qipengyuania algicida]